MLTSGLDSGSKENRWKIRATSSSEIRPLRLYASYFSLGKINDTRAVEPLISFLRDEDGDVQSTANEALTKLEGQPGSAHYAGLSITSSAAVLFMVSSSRSLIFFIGISNLSASSDTPPAC